MKNRRGDVLDIIPLILGLVIVCIILLIINQAFHEMRTPLEGLSAVYGPPAMASVASAFSILDAGMVMLIFGGMVAVWLLASQIETSGPLLVFAFMFLILIVVVAAMAADMFEDISSSAALATSAADFSLTIAAMRKLGLIAGFGGGITVLVMFMRWRQR